MKIKMKHSRWFSPDGFKLRHLQANTEYDLSENAARMLMADGFAELVEETESEASNV